MGALSMVRSLNRTQRNTFIASFLGWTLDAFDYFVVSFVVIYIAKDFRQAIPLVALTITVTLMMRPLGALIFGILADRFGRRVPLMADIIFYSLIELLTAFSPNFTIFFILRALYGIGMGGEWGVGASLAMEAVPTESRGLFSGILQQGYAVGYLIAAIVFGVIAAIVGVNGMYGIGWRILFVIGVLPALLVLFIRTNVPESEVWEQQHQERVRTRTTIWTTLWEAIKQHWVLFIYAVLLMTAFNYMSHGTQDLYPTFLEKQRGLSPGTVSLIAIIYNIGAICGGTTVGYLSQRWGRRRSIIIAAILGIIVIPLWAFSPSLVLLTIGAFLIQFMVQGAWGIIPVHLNELSPENVRGTFPGFTYQLGNLISANAAFLEAQFAENFKTAQGMPDYALTQAVLAAIIFVAVIILTAIGREARGIEFGRPRPEVAPVEGSEVYGGQ
jgi:SHS family lactate transporter-like MFS transporter